MKIISTEKIPVKMWLNDIEEGAMKQALNLANFPFAFHHIAIMPDSHQGYGMPIGGVMATKDVIVPNAVGVDIGCGMCAVKTSLTELDTETLKNIMGEIRKAVPVGFNHHKEKQDPYLMPRINGEFNASKEWMDKNMPVVGQERQSALTQIGTLGGGNHFIEIQKGSDGYIWIMIHSGSRNLGKQVADHYNKLAIALNKKWHTSVDPKWELAFLPLESEEGQSYIREMQYCVDFALANRKLMMDRICRIVSNFFMKETGEFSVIQCFDDVPEKTIKSKCTKEEARAIKDKLSKPYSAYVSFKINKEYSSIVSFEPMINIAHNYAKQENHFGFNVWVHRKGATLASDKTIGIIPGSQGTNSYIVKGKGNKESFDSCSHGAGRKMSRTKAENELNLDEEIKKLNDLGVVHGIRSKKDLDEASGAYKDIDEVMANQEDLVEILVKLTPLGVIKG